MVGTDALFELQLIALITFAMVRMYSSLELHFWKTYSSTCLASPGTGKFGAVCRLRASSGSLIQSLIKEKQKTDLQSMNYMISETLRWPIFICRHDVLWSWSPIYCRRIKERRDWFLTNGYYRLEKWNVYLTIKE